MKTLSIVIPCYNEKATIHEILKRIFAVSIPSWDIEVVIVDDHSTDGTRDLLRGYESRARIIYRTENGGKGSAVRDGLAAARGDYIIIQDADLEYDPREIPALVGALGDGRSVVYGSRNLVPHARKGFIIPRLGVWFITKLINLLYKTKLTDVWTCYKLFPKEIKGMFGPGKFDAEILFTLELLRAGYHISEISISHSPRSATEGKKILYRDGFQAIWIILRDWFRHPNFPITDKTLLVFFIATIVIAIASLSFFRPFIWPFSDSPSYIQAMDVLQGAPQPAGFFANRIITTTGGMGVVILFSKLMGSYEAAWLSMNIVFFILLSLLFYRLIFLIHGSKKVAALSALFLAGNYAVVVFGLSYYMDIGGWFFYIASALGVLHYAQSDQANRHRYLWLAAVAVGIGGLFKEYAFLGAFLIGFYLAYECWPSIARFIKKASIPALIVAVPTAILHIYTYAIYHYTYMDWLAANQAHYIYHSRIIEYIKTFGSLLNFLGLLALIGLYYFFKDKNGSDVAKRKNTKAFTVCFFLSAALILFWPAITQRITFVSVPVSIILASYLFKRFDRRWYLFLPLLAIYIWAAFYMDSFILNFVNLPF